MSKRLEDFMKMNREEFDDLEPSADLWSRIEKHLPAQEVQLKPKEKKTFSLGFVISVAASIIVVMCIGFSYYLHTTEKHRGIDFAAINPVYAKQQVQYTSMIESKRTELKAIAATDPELYKEFNSEIAQMEATYKELSSDLATSPDQERVLRAMIHNLRIQTDVLNRQLSVIEQMHKMKNENNDNETKGI